MMHLFYLCIIIIKDDTNNMIQVNYFNGSYSRANKVSPKDFGQVGKAIIMASNEGWPYQGKPDDMARDAICHINPQFRNPTNSLRSLRSKPPRMRFLLFKLAFCHILTDMSA